MTSFNLVRGCLVIVGKVEIDAKIVGGMMMYVLRLVMAFVFLYCHHVVHSFNHRCVDSSVCNNHCTSGNPLTSSGQTFPFPWFVSKQIWDKTSISSVSSDIVFLWQADKITIIDYWQASKSFYRYCLGECAHFGSSLLIAVISFFVFLYTIGMLSGLQAVLATQPSQVWLMPMPTLSHQESPVTGTKCTTTCQSWPRPLMVRPTHWLMSYKKIGGGGGRRKGE